MLDFTRLLMDDAILNGKLLVKHDGKINGFRFGSLGVVFPIKLVVKYPIKLDDLKDSLHNGVDTTEASPIPIPSDWNF